MIELTVQTTPIAQPRQRHSARVRLGKLMVHNYTPKNHPVQQYKRDLQIACQSVYQGEPLTGPLQVDFVFVMPRPVRMTWKRRPMPRERHAVKPDKDNIAKATQDALTGLLWKDDSQICAGSTEKWIAAGDEQPHVIVRVFQL